MVAELQNEVEYISSDLEKIEPWNMRQDHQFINQVSWTFKFTEPSDW